MSVRDHFERNPDTGRAMPKDDLSEYGAQTKYAVGLALAILLPVMVFVAVTA